MFYLWEHGIEMEDQDMREDNELTTVSCVFRIQ